MITYNQIGHFGRLGNQMFQFASCYGIANKLGYEVAFPLENATQPATEHFKDGKTLEVFFDIPKVFNIDPTLLKPKLELITKHDIQEPFFHFSSDLFRISDSSNLKGYYQTEKYFKHCELDIKRLFDFNQNIRQEAHTKFPDTKLKTVSIHVRVGDYKGLSEFHPICEPEYYAKASQLFTDDDYMFLIFSDDITYCKTLFGEAENILYITDNTGEVDMCMMSMCNHNIIANSSFSWWGAWLNSNKDKKVIAPRKWFGPAYYFHNTNDLYCPEWIQM